MVSLRQESSSIYDSYGRPTATYDADGNKTGTSYTTTGGLTTATTVTNALQQRFARDGSKEDADAAIDLAEQSARPPQPPQPRCAPGHLGAALTRQAKRTAELAE